MWDWPFVSLTPDCAELTPGAYGLILADPPWAWRAWSEAGQGRDPEYDTMTIDELRRLPVGMLADRRGCHLACWIDDAFLSIAIRMIEDDWGFEYKSKLFVWDKRKVSKGFDTRNETESCYRFARGTRPPARLDKAVRQVIAQAPRPQHSRKPDEQYERLQRLYMGQLGVRTCELFARYKRPGIEPWGNQVGLL